MLSFYQKLASKLNEDGAGQSPAAPAAPGAKAVSFKATGERVTPPANPEANAAPANAPAPADPAPEGTEPLEVDLFQSEARMVVFAQLPGVAKDDFEITIDEEASTLVIQASQKRPALPPLATEAATPDAAASAKKEDTEKGRFTKQEIGWKTLYRKVYAPAPFDAGEARALLDRGVLVIVLPAKKPGAGKKLAVKELLDEK